MRAEYESIELEVITFDSGDVIVTSVTPGPGQETNEGPIKG